MATSSDPITQYGVHLHTKAVSSYAERADAILTREKGFTLCRQTEVNPSMPLAKCERLVSMLCALAWAGRTLRHVSCAEVFATAPGFVSPPSEDAADKAWQRDMRCLRASGAEIRYDEYTTVGRQGYILPMLNPPPDLAGKPKVWQAALRILYWTRNTDGIPVKEVLLNLPGWNQAELEDCLMSMSMSGHGHMPHELLDARIESGLVIVDGPNPYRYL